METCSNTASNRMVEMIEKFSDVKTTSDAWPSDLVRKASLTARASLCILRPASNTSSSSRASLDQGYEIGTLSVRYEKEKGLRAV